MLGDWYYYWWHVCNVVPAQRADFHGAVTYAFKGIFAWQMYSAVDAVDEFGKAYTVSTRV